MEVKLLFSYKKGKSFRIRADNVEEMHLWLAKLRATKSTHMNATYFLPSEVPTNLIPGLLPRNSKEKEPKSEEEQQQQSDPSEKKALRKSQTTSDINERNKENDEKREKVKPYSLPWLTYPNSLVYFKKGSETVRDFVSSTCGASI